MDASKIIADLGGRHAVSELTGAKPNAVTQWSRIGIPPKYWHQLVTHKPDTITFEMLQASKPGAAEAAA